MPTPGSASSLVPSPFESADGEALGTEIGVEPDSEAVERRETVVSDGLHGQRLDKAVVSTAPEFSRTHLQTLIERGFVKIDDEVVTQSARKVIAGSQLRITLIATAESRAFRAEPLPIDVVYEDDDLLVVDKAAGMVVHPAAGNWSGTLLNALLSRHANAARLPRAGIVHRLDKDTSGLMVVGKTLPSITALSRAIAARVVHREYLAIVEGEVRDDAFEIDAPIARDPRSRVRMAVVTAGKPARTHVQSIARHAGFSAIRCTLHTGRTHQIRLHLASRGHPLLGDGLYGGKPAMGMTRQALHATRLAFAHPLDGTPLAFERGPPADLARAWSEIVGGT